MSEAIAAARGLLLARGPARLATDSAIIVRGQ
jgi:hypothetical protein